MTTVAVYNAGGTQLLHRVDLLHAIRMLNRRVARVLDAEPGRRFGPYPLPKSLGLVRWIYTRWVWEATGAPPVSKANILRRDRYRCAYCGRRATTHDHIRPRSAGGRTTWLNCVAACQECNGRKGSLSLAQAGMRLLFDPFVPVYADLYPDRR